MLQKQTKWLKSSYGFGTTIAVTFKKFHWLKWSLSASWEPVGENKTHWIMAVRNGLNLEAL